MTTPVHDPRVDRLDQRVAGLESAVADIGSSIKDLGKKFDERSRPQWVVIVGALGLVVTLLGVVGAAWKAPIDGIVARQEQDLREVKSAIVPRVEHEYHWTAVEQADADIKKRLDRLEGTVFAGAPEVRP